MNELKKIETFVPIQTPTGAFVGEIIDRLNEIDDEETMLHEKLNELTGEA